MSTQQQPTTQELLVNHLVYEINQMFWALTMLGQVKAPEGWAERWQIALNNALMEAFYMHARALFEFFKKDRGAKKYADASYEPFKGVEIDGWEKKLAK